MHPKNLFKKWPSVSTAAAMLLGLQRTEANTTELTGSDEVKKGEPYEPLILKPPKVKVIPEHLFAGHTSHSSHSSHSSGSGSSSSRPYTPVAPSYVPVAPRATYTPYGGYSRATPAPRATPIPNSTPESLTRIDLTNGAVIYGTLLTKSAAGITLKGMDQKSYKIPRLILAGSTIASLALPPEQ
ncbi:MAG: hypothetical protein QOK24_2724 [Verrucomicrobiota bacterium]|jgi:hypothetical protein